MKILQHITVAIAILVTPCALATAHNNLNDAKEALRHAQTTQDVEDLRSAKHFIERAIEATENDRRFRPGSVLKRKDALEQVKEALKAIEAGDRLKSGKFITQALKMIDEAIGIDDRKR